jgi:hypothetical protein
VKEKDPSSKSDRKVNLRTSTSNLFLNIIIVVLGLLIIFMSYSLVTKIKGTDEGEDITDYKVSSAIVQLEVLNGCGISGIAEKFTNFLRQKNFDVVQVGNYISYDIDKSLVIDRTGNKANAIKVADALGIDRKYIVQQINNDYFLDVSLVIGKDFNQLKPSD